MSKMSKCPYCHGGVMEVEPPPFDPENDDSVEERRHVVCTYCGGSGWIEDKTKRMDDMDPGPDYDQQARDIFTPDGHPVM